jgi:FkbM family methyltransferase
MNKCIEFWDKQIVKRHIGSELNILMNYLNSLPDKNISFIDIGGNVGKFYDELRDSFNVEKCVIVEPSLALYEYMKEKYKDKKEIVLHNFGISNKSGKFKFNDSAIEYWSNKELDESINLGLSKVENGEGDTIFHTMDFFMEQINCINPQKITFIKIDTENKDLFILRDLTKYITHHNIKPLILFENNFHNDMTLEVAQNIVTTMCEKCGYKNVDLRINGDMVLFPVL